MSRKFEIRSEAVLPATADEVFTAVTTGPVFAA